jgi:hypothetical protein
LGFRKGIVAIRNLLKARGFTSRKYSVFGRPIRTEARTHSPLHSGEPREMDLHIFALRVFSPLVSLSAAVWTIPTIGPKLPPTFEMYLAWLGTSTVLSSYMYVEIKYPLGVSLNLHKSRNQALSLR